jgi:hypothetical protein
MKNPINAQPNCLQGKQLPANWRAQAAQRAAAAEAAYLNRIENAWRQGPEKGFSGSLSRDARLNQDRADSGHDGPQVRFDGQMQLVEDRADGWQLWRDNATGASVWRRLGWRDVLGEK